MCDGCDMCMWCVCVWLCVVCDGGMCDVLAWCLYGFVCGVACVMSVVCYVYVCIWCNSVWLCGRVCGFVVCVWGV